MRLIRFKDVDGDWVYVNPKKVNAVFLGEEPKTATIVMKRINFHVQGLPENVAFDLQVARSAKKKGT